MYEKVIKRDKQVVEFRKDKITNAIYQGMISVYLDRNANELKKLSEVISDKVIYNMEKKSYNREYPSVEEIQDAVEETLMEMGERKTAREYIRYRMTHQYIRSTKKSLIDAEKIVDEYVSEENWRVKENSNMGFSLQGLNNHIISEVTKNFWLDRVYTNTISKAHRKGDFHIHDLGLLAPYCCGWSFEDLLLKGFKGAEGKVESKPPKHFKTALGQLVNFFYTLQGEAAGAQAISSFDTYLAPFVKFDNLDYKKVKQSMQEFIFNLNVPTRVGFQTPFVNLTMDLICPNNLKEMPIIIGGKNNFEYSYGEFQEQMDMINNAFSEVMMEGDAKGRIFTFPIPTYNISKDFDWESPVFDSVIEMTAKYGIPYFANFVNSDMDPEDARSMCCRLRLDNRELRKRGGGLFGANPLTGSIGVVTVNMPRLGYVSKDKADFFERLRRIMDIAKSSLETKRKMIEKSTVNGLYPYSKFYLSEVQSGMGDYWKNHFSTIGINGMNECIENFFGNEENITTEKGLKFAVEALEYMREAMREYQEETGNLYNLEATPAEGTAYRLAKLDKEMYPGIIAAGSEVPYYTNSSQLPVGHTEDLFEALDLQEPLQTLYTGGTVFHGFLGESIEDMETCKLLLRRVMENYEIPYFTISPTFSVCGVHGYLRGEQPTCPKCGAETEIWTRVVGFHRPVKSWNKGKREEYKERKVFSMQKASGAF
ncbi:MAG: ribonucleoside triphosphate reductase [Peptostreptococcaceae bacterium]|nr:ribonucleoside triphosphate reductase [Peptostreptococcaceae bacterium]